MSLSAAFSDDSDIRIHASVPKGLTRATLKLHWHAFRSAFLQCCGEHGKHEFTGGVLASVLPPAEFLRLFHLAANTVVPPGPGDFDPGVDNIDVYKLRASKYQRYTQYLAAVTKIWRVYMDDSLFSAISDPDFLLARVSLQDQYTHIEGSVERSPDLCRARP